MPKASLRKTERRSEESVLDQATRQLLAAVKAKAKQQGRPLDCDKLRKDGYSERFVDKVENA
jgi:hypothetical protein